MNASATFRIISSGLVFFFMAIWLLPVPVMAAAAPSIPAPQIGSLPIPGLNAHNDSLPWTVLILFTILTLLPALLLSMTPFVRILLVFHFLRQALGTQTAPTNQTLLGLALFLTYFVMQPVGVSINKVSVEPFAQGSITAWQAVERSATPLRQFMLKYTREKDLALFVEMSREPRPSRPDDLSIRVVAPAYASSQVDKRKAGRLAQAIQVAFQDLGVFQTSNTKIPLQDDDAMPFEKVQTVENTNRKADLARIVNPMKGTLTSWAESQSLQEAQKEIQNVLRPEIKKHEVTMAMRGDGLIVSLKEMGFFESGSATIRPDSIAALSRLAEVLKQREENVRIEGHTDNIPIHNVHFASNWELSTARATEIIRLMITQFGLPASRLSAAGYGEFHPAASNETPAGRAQNRRLDVVILAPFQALNGNSQNPIQKIAPSPSPPTSPSVAP